MEVIDIENHQNKFNENIPLKRIGNFIKEARISRNQSISDLATNLKISENQIKALEEGREDLLPEIVFIKAMVRRVSEKLKLDTNFIMGEFNNQSEEISIEEIVEDVSKKPKVSKKVRFGFLVTIFVSGLIGLIASSFIFSIFSNRINETDKKELIKNN